MIKVGRRPLHTGALTGSDDVFDAVCRRTGVLRVNTIKELFGRAEVLAKQPRPRGPPLAIVTNAGGPGARAVDAGAEFAPLSSVSVAELDGMLPPHWSHGNAIVFLGDADAERFTRAVEIAARDAASDGMLAILTPQAMTDATATARQIKAAAVHGDGKPVLESWMGGSTAEPGEKILNDVAIPIFKYPARAARAFACMWRYSSKLKLFCETPEFFPALPARGERRAHVENIIAAARQSRRTLLNEFESKQALVAYGIPTVETRVAASGDSAAAAAEQLGFPVAVKEALVDAHGRVAGARRHRVQDRLVRVAHAARESVPREGALLFFFRHRGGCDGASLYHQRTRRLHTHDW